MAEFVQTAPKETAKAAQAFADYVAMGPDRSLRKLHAYYCQLPANQVPTKRFETLAEWSSWHGWQSRMAEAVTTKAMDVLSHGTELKSDTWITILGEYNRRVSDEPMRKVMKLEGLHGIYDRVKPETPSSSQPIGGNVLIQFVFNAVTEHD